MRLYCYLLFACTVYLYGQDVGKEKIIQLSKNAALKISKKSQKTINTEIDTILTFEDDIGPLLYIVNFKEKGFVIMSSDYSISPILGGTTGENYNKEDAPPGLNYLIRKYMDQTRKLKKDENRKENLKKDEWELLARAPIPDPDPEPIPLEVPNLLTTIWHQGSALSTSRLKP